MKRLLSFLTIIFLLNTVASAGNISKGIRISYSITDDQIHFIDNHFDYVMTPFLNDEIRQSIQKPKLLLYRSIQGTWEEFNHFDWAHIDLNENMFCHSDSADQSRETRILTRWNSWLMDGNDLVDSTAADAMNHWVNYYAVTASSQVYSYDYDGLFIDSAGHKLSESAVFGIMPWDYSSDTWRDGRYAALQFIKSYLPDKTVIFNGLHSGNGADSSLSFTDGGMWEDFVYDIDNGTYKGEKKWWGAIQCMQDNHDDAYLVLVVKKPGLVDDYQARIFSVASYLLISNSNVSLSLSDYANHTSLQYYPEYDISLGNSTGDFFMLEDSLFIRKFEHGIVLVNPSASSSRVYDLTTDFYKVIPIGGGFVDASGNYEGALSYEKVSGEIEIPPVSGLILKDSLATSVENDDPAQIGGFELSQNYPNPFNLSTIINYHLAQPARVEIAIYNILGQKIQTLVNEKQQSGTHTITWDGTDAAGNVVSSGIFYYQLVADDYRSGFNKMILLK